MLPADEPLVIDASLADGYILLSFHDVTEGRVTFIGSNHDDQLWLKGADDPNTIDQLILGTGSDLVEVVSRDTSRMGSNTIANRAGIDEVSNFNVAGKDQIILTKQPNELYEISVESADQVDFVSRMNSALVDAGMTSIAAAGDIYRVDIAAGEMAGTYVISDKTGDLVTPDDEVLKLTGKIGDIRIHQFSYWWY